MFNWIILFMMTLVSCEGNTLPEYHNFTTEHTKTVDIDYLLYAPANYRPTEEWPLILYLTGMEGVDDINMIRNFGPPKAIEAGLDFDGFVVAPQLPGDVHWDPDALNALMEDIQATYRIDDSQRYITGIGDRGGWGVYEFGVSYPGIFQRFAPMSAPACTEICRLGPASTWIFHGAKDTLVPVADAENMYFEMQTYCGTTDQITIYDDLGHNIWERAYSEPGFWKWFVGKDPVYTGSSVTPSIESFHTEIIKPIDDDYLLYLPTSYGEVNQEWPLVIFLHGSGGAIENIDDIRVNGPAWLYEHGMDSEFILLCPQLHANVHWDVDRIHTLTQNIMNTYDVDTRRIYITGLSRGGFGTWEYAVSHPDLFAAVVPISARDVPGVERLANTNTWIFHGDQDTGVPWQGSQFMFNRLNTVGANVHLTLYEGVGHNAWDLTYNSDGFWSWLLTQRSITTRTENHISNPQEFALRTNYPNPFNAFTTINYALPVATQMTLKIFDILGHEVVTLWDDYSGAGDYSLNWNGIDDLGNTLGSGIYLCQLQTENHTSTLKMSLLK